MNVKQNYETPVSTVISVCTEQMFAISGAGGETVKPGGDLASASVMSIWD